MVKPRSSKERGFRAEQMEFEDVVEMETIAGDPDYTTWLAAGKPARSSGRNLAEDPDAGVRE